MGMSDYIKEHARLEKVLASGTPKQRQEERKRQVQEVKETIKKLMHKQMKKICRICMEKKSIECFTKNKMSSDGYANMCRLCCSEYRQMLRGVVKKETLEMKMERMSIQNGSFFVSFKQMITTIDKQEVINIAYRHIYQILEKVLKGNLNIIEDLKNLTYYLEDYIV